jgi:predicted metal-dependent HD superfamily phosphohydrolase
MKPLKELSHLDFTLVMDHNRRIFYRLNESIVYYSKRYKNTLTCLKGELSDGATGATDIVSLAWWVHDKVCTTWRWDNGAKITKWQASMILHDILLEEGRCIRAVGWLLVTFLLGPNPKY